ncbi:MAG TPA: cytochrome P450 [Polyangiales bacterium]|nr:cytochrome P450 [Polyangiales bacterium]
MENKCPVKFHNVDFCDPKTHDNPYEMYDYFLEHEPIYFDEKNGVWEVFRYDDIVTIERDTETFINGEGVRPNIPPDPAMIYQDGEQHNKQRALVSSAFTPRQMRKMEDRVREIVKDLVDQMLAKDEVEIVTDLAAALPMRLIADMLDIPEEKRPAVQQWINGIMMGGCGPDYVTDEVNEAFENFVMHHEEMVQDRVAAGCTGSDIITIWMNAEINGEKLDESQLLFEHVLLNVGGAETTRSAIAGGLERLSNDPKQYDALYEDPSLIPNAVEEIIRWVCPFVNMYRTATRDYEMHGKVIKEGQQVGLTYPAANRDPRKYKDPHTFNIFRDFSQEAKHLSFGLGPHFCLGASLARLEVRLSLEEMTRRVKSIRIPEGKALEYVSSSFTRGLKSFPAILEPR